MSKEICQKVFFNDIRLYKLNKCYIYLNLFIKQRQTEKNKPLKPQRAGEGRRKYRGEEHTLYVFIRLFDETRASGKATHVLKPRLPPCPCPLTQKKKSNVAPSFPGVPAAWVEQAYP